LEEPVSGSVLGKQGKVNFSWTETTGAEYYVLTFTKADGSTAKIQTTDVNAEFYIEVLPAGGEYQWNVTAFGAGGTSLCTSASGSFSKPQADPTEKGKPNDPDKPAPLDPAATEDLSQCDADPCSNQACPGYSSECIPYNP
jgi:hypothetical protein